MREVVLFYAADGAAAKARAKTLKSKTVSVRIIHAEVCNAAERCDDIEFMPDVDQQERARLSALFGKCGDAAPAKESVSPNPGLTVGKGPGGRWYVKDGKAIHSGPYADEADANAARAKELST